MSELDPDDPLPPLGFELEGGACAGGLLEELVAGVLEGDEVTGVELELEFELE